MIKQISSLIGGCLLTLACMAGVNSPSNLMYGRGAPTLPQCHFPLNNKPEGISQSEETPSVEVEVPNTVEVDQPFKVTFILPSKPQNTLFNSSSDFEILVGPAFSTSLIISDGNTIKKFRVTYILKPLHKGRFLLPSFQTEAEGKVKISPSRYVTVVLPGEQTVAKISPQDSLFVRVIVDKPSVRKGESIFLEFKIYTLADIQSLTDVPIIDIPYCYIEEQKLELSGNFSKEEFQGNIYKMFIYKQFKLTPLQQGEIKLLPIRFTFDVVEKDVKSVDPFDAFFNEKVTEKRTVLSNPVTIRVMP